MKGRFWEVVGGADKGGILVRKRLALTSDLEDSRLAMGSVVRQIEMIGERLHYELLSGTGPQSGWVSARLSGKELVALLPMDSNRVPTAALTSKSEDSNIDASDVPDLLSGDEAEMEIALQDMGAKDAHAHIDGSGLQRTDRQHNVTSIQHRVKKVSLTLGASQLKADAPHNNERIVGPREHSKADGLQLKGLRTVEEISQQMASAGLTRVGDVGRISRYYRVKPETHCPIFEHPVADAKPCARQGPGALVSSTGRSEGIFIEIVTILNIAGWMPLNMLLPFEDSEDHGNIGFPTDAFDNAAASSCFDANHQHKLSLLSFCLPAMNPSNSRLLHPPSGTHCLDHQGHRAYILGHENMHLSTRSENPLPLLILLHGTNKGVAWKFDELVDAVRHLQSAMEQSFLILLPEAQGSSWDCITLGTRKDIDFIQWAVDEIRNTYCIDDTRIAIAGWSDGASMALSLALRNPNACHAALVRDVGFCFLDPHMVPSSLYKPKVFMEFSVGEVDSKKKSWALNFKQNWVFSGYQVKFRLVGADDCDLVQHEFFCDACSYWLEQAPRSSVNRGQEVEEIITERGLGEVSDEESEVGSASEFEMSGYGGIYLG